jgi:hypothetical protein
VQLLFRTAHGAVVHPARPATIVLFGGYGGGPSGPWTWLNDLVLVHTDRWGARLAVEGGMV